MAAESDLDEDQPEDPPELAAAALDEMPSLAVEAPQPYFTDASDADRLVRRSWPWDGSTFCAAAAPASSWSWPRCAYDQMSTEMLLGMPESVAAPQSAP